MMPNDPQDPVAQAKELGRIVAPYLTVYVALQLAAARYQGHSAMPSSKEWRTGVLVESLEDALILLKVI